MLSTFIAVVLTADDKGEQAFGAVDLAPHSRKVAKLIAVLAS
jgi:hypothetical protein